MFCANGFSDRLGNIVLYANNYYDFYKVVRFFFLTPFQSLYSIQEFCFSLLVGIRVIENELFLKFSGGGYRDSLRQFRCATLYIGYRFYFNNN